MRFSTLLLLASTNLITLTGCGGLSDQEDGNDEATGDFTPVDSAVDFNDYDNDGRQDGYLDPIVVIQPGTVEESSVPLLCIHQSAILFTEEGCYAGYGVGLEDQSWTSCVIRAKWATFQGERYQCGAFTDNGDEFRVNLWNPTLEECTDTDDASYGSQACWAIINENARPDEFASRNEDKSYAVAIVIVNNYAYPGSGTATGEE